MFHIVKPRVQDTLKLQRDIDRLGSWTSKWGMRFEPVKCNMIQFAKIKHINKIKASHILDGTALENVESIKYLGVTMTYMYDLQWNTHTSNVSNNTDRTLGFFGELCS